MGRSEKYRAHLASDLWRREIRPAQLERDGYRCQMCGDMLPPPKLDIHHNNYRRLGKEKPEDITSFCRPCHIVADAMRSNRTRGRHIRRPEIEADAWAEYERRFVFDLVPCKIPEIMRLGYVFAPTDEYLRRVFNGLRASMFIADRAVWKVADVDWAYLEYLRHRRVPSDSCKEPLEWLSVYVVYQADAVLTRWESRWSSVRCEQVILEQAQLVEGFTWARIWIEENLPDTVLRDECDYVRSQMRELWQRVKAA